MASTSADSEAGGAKAMMRSVSTGLQELGARVTQTIERYVSVGTGAGAMAAHSTRSAEDDEEALMWATLEKLPTYDRLRKTVLCDLKGSRRRLDTVDVRSLKQQDREAAIDNIIGSDAPADNEKFLSKLRERLEKVGIELPRVEIRFENLHITAQCYVGSRALPTLWNAALNFTEGLLNSVVPGISRNNKTTITILDDVSGIIKPGRMTLLLGPPTCGKSTLLLSLANRLDSNLKVMGKVSYNGHEFHEFVAQKTSVYVSQMDLHQGELTVRETLDFSARCQGIGARFDLLEELCKRERELGIRPDPDVDFYMKATAVEGKGRNFSTDYTLKILGLDVCADTVVGDAMRRGISGGQKKRVTTGELIVGPSRVLLMDQISDGLDSSTTFQIIQCLGQLAHYMDYTIVISLLQPAPETYDLFDDILLLSEGQICYHGPRIEATSFFETMGFACPSRKAVPDFLQELTSIKDQEQYWADKSKPYRYITVKEMAAAFKSYHVGTNMTSNLNIPFDKSTSHKAALAFDSQSLSKRQIFKTVVQREVLMARRNSLVFFFRLWQIIFIGLVGMGMFIRPRMHRHDLQNAQLFNAAQFFGLTNTLFNGYADLALMVARLPVFFKQRELYFFPGWSFALSFFVLGVPVTFLEVPAWVALTYYPIGYAPFIGRFFKHTLLLLILHSMAGSLFRFVAGVCRSMVISNSGGSAVLLIIFTMGGLLVPRKPIKSWWIWGYWITPLSYANNGISVNEFMAHQWKKPVAGSNRWLGIEFLHDVSLFAHGYWYWISAAALVGFVVFFNVGFGFATTFMKPLGRLQAVIPAKALAGKEASKNGTTLPTTGSSGPAVPTPAALDRDRSTSSAAAPSRQSPMNLEPLTARRSEVVTARPPAARHGMILPFQPYSMSFKDLNYFVDMPPAMRSETSGDKLQLLHNITGAFRPGVLTALVGVTGAGKTTLMDVLAGRKTGGYIEGDLRISGFPKNQESFARIAGYCEQTDIHSSQVTVEESLIYSAWLRLPDEVTNEQRTAFVDEVMQLVELTELKGALVGIPGQSGLSTEQRKRLTIGVELVANPSIIFMDEPTSGLDARAAAIVMRTVRNTVDTGRTVVCTIHQPSIEIFEAFDELLLMKRGGRLIYAGHLGKMSRDLIEYFETTVPDVPKYKSGMNPATWMLEISNNATEKKLDVDFAEVYMKSYLYEKNKAIVDELSSPAPGAKDLEFSTKYSRGWKAQFTACLWKQNLTYWRSPDYVNVRFIFTLIAALLMGTVFWRMGHRRRDQLSIYSVMGSFYASILFIGVTNAQTVQPLIASERLAFYRERAAGMYSAYPYAIAQILNEVPYSLLQATLYTCIVYPMIYLEWTASKFFWQIYFLYFVYLTFTYYGMMAVSVTPNPEVASILGSAFYQIFNLFSGFLIPKPKIPPYFIWIYWICPTAYALYGLVVSQYGDLHGDDHLMTTLDGSKVSVAYFTEHHFGFKHGFIGGVAGLASIYPLVFAVIFVICISKLSFQHR
ncbi:ATP-binding cassette, subfamily G (WHITE), member 2, PDR [Marchantia polymorpha subsp. ruderalis]